MMGPHKRAAIHALLLLLLASCGPSSPPSFGKGGGPPPAAAGARALGLASAGTLPPRPAPPRPLKVIHRSPSKHAEGLSAVVVTFDQPMAALGRATTSSPDRWPLVVTPPVQGALRWVAGDTAKLALTRPLQNARRYRVTVPASLRALSGDGLTAPVSWTFETPRPRLVRVLLRPAETRRHGRLLPGDRLEVLFNLRVDPAAARASLALLVNGAPWPFSTGRAAG